MAGRRLKLSAGGSSADAAGQIYVSTGNGTFDANTGGPDYGDSFVKLDPSTLGVLDFFTPFNQAMLSDEDLDLGSGALMLLPDQPGPNPHLAVTPARAPRCTSSIAIISGNSTAPPIRSSAKFLVRLGRCSEPPPISTDVSISSAVANPRSHSISPTVFSPRALPPWQAR